MPDTLLYLATGKEEFLLQARYAALSAVGWDAGDACEVVIYTDAPAYFDGLGPRVRCELLPAERSRAWRGRWDFFYRVKPAAIADALDRAGGGRVLFLDADTFFTGPVARAFDRIDASRAVMHVREYHVGTQPGVQMRKFRRRMQRARFRGRPGAIDFWMWNSGAVGLHPAHRPMLDEWVEFVDAVWPSNPKPIIEQYGISWLLQREAIPIAPIDDLVVHYHPDKDRHLAAIRARIGKLATLPLADAVRFVREHPIAIPGKPPRPPRRPFWTRIWESVREKRRVRALVRRGGVGGA